ncbi:MAG TPA: ABC transporter permease [Candidatus Limnocylindrales bacterium]|nr:ABC transporter permease [Candidatus Limnocylindrales bacterium]
MIDWGWVGDHLGALLSRTIQHVELAAIAVAFGFAISFGLALLVIAYRRTFPVISGIAGILYTIPSLAVFAALVSITGLTIYTAELPLIMYTLVILVRNIVAGFDSVPRDVLEAADGMGYDRRERFQRIVLPLSVPLMVAGLRLASVSSIGLVTITATLGASFGGLGFFIFEGYHREFPTEILAGAVPSIVLAIVVDLAFVRLQRRLTPWAGDLTIRRPMDERRTLFG